MSEDFEREENIFSWGKNNRPENVRVQLGQMIYELRKTSKVTREDLAAVCEINVYRLERIENGDIENPAPELLATIAQAVGLRFSKSESRFNELLEKLSSKPVCTKQTTDLSSRVAAASAGGH